MIEAVGEGVFGLRAGQRVLATGHIVVAENVSDPAEALLSMTARSSSMPLLNAWREGTMAELAVVPASTVTPIPTDLDAVPGSRLSAVTRCLVPYGGLQRGRLRAGESVLINGATGDFGTAAVHVARAMGAARIVAAGRNQAILTKLGTHGRVVPVRLTGDIEADGAALREAAGGGADCALDTVGNASDTAATQVLQLVAAGLLELDAIEVVEFLLPELRAAIDAAAVPGGPLVVLTPSQARTHS